MKTGQKIPAMCNKTTCFPLNITFSPCSLNGIEKNLTSTFQAVVLSTSVIITILLSIAVVGNGLVLAAIWKNPSLRTPSYIILAGLAFTDLCTGLVTQPFYIALQLTCLQDSRGSNKSWMLYFGTTICGIYFTYLTLVFILLMSIERWLHMNRRLLLTRRRTCFIVAVVSLLLIPLAAILSNMRYEFASGIILIIVLFFCGLVTSVAYFKVFRIIRHHQNQVHSNESSQNFGQPAIDLAKYKKSVFSILYILGVFYLCYLPFLVVFAAMMFVINMTMLEVASRISTLFLFLASSINPVIYIWRMTPIRTGVNFFVRKILCMESN